MILVKTFPLAFRERTDLPTVVYITRPEEKTAVRPRASKWAWLLGLFQRTLSRYFKREQMRRGRCGDEKCLCCYTSSLSWSHCDASHSVRQSKLCVGTPGTADGDFCTIWRCTPENAVEISSVRAFGIENPASTIAVKQTCLYETLLYTNVTSFPQRTQSECITLPFRSDPHLYLPGHGLLKLLFGEPRSYKQKRVETETCPDVYEMNKTAWNRDDELFWVTFSRALETLQVGTAVVVVSWSAEVIKTLKLS